jgi:hypothetical protein
MITINEALNNYYEFKTLYENSYNKEKKNIINDKTISWNEKRQNFKKLKYKCINCKRPVGTIFSQKNIENEKDNFRLLSAKCGDIVNPCPLNIQIKLDFVHLLQDYINELENDIKEVKNTIIKDKNNLLFGLVNSEKILNNFDTLKPYLNETYETKNSYLELLINKTDNFEKKKELDTLITETYEIIKNIKQDIQNFNADNNSQLVQDTIKNNYVDLLMTKPENPISVGKLEQIRNLKYNYNTVEYDEDVNEYYLIQKINTIQNLEIPYNSKVVSYVFGITQSKSKTKKNKASSKTKTKKLLIETSTSDEEKMPDIENIDIVKENKKSFSKNPIIKENGSIEWEDPIYKKAWSKLSPRHKEYLSKDLEWLQNSMDSYVKNEQEFKMLKFVFPTNVVFPPTKTPNGTYDFDNELYNEVNNNNKELIINYLKDIDKIGQPNNNITQEKADLWFKTRMEYAIYDFLYPEKSQLIKL